MASAEVCFSTRMWDGRVQPELPFVLFEMTASEYLENDSTGVVALCESALWALAYQGGPLGPCWGRVLQRGSVGNMPKHAQNICTHITKPWLHGFGGWHYSCTSSWVSHNVHHWILLFYWQKLGTRSRRQPALAASNVLGYCQSVSLVRALWLEDNTFEYSRSWLQHFVARRLLAFFKPLQNFVF